MAAALRASGVTGVTGRFLVWGGALPYLREIDADQPDWFGYNPCVSGINLNFNRVNFAWKQGPEGVAVGMDARGERFVPAVYTARVEVVERAAPLFTYSGEGTVESWTVARGALNREGSRWLPVRRPEAYAGDVFQTLARAQGTVLPDPGVANGLPGGATVILERQSAPLPLLLRDMLKYSTNLTAEAIGMAASARDGVRDHARSGPAMAAWLRGQTGASPGALVDHSGLGPASRMTAEEMVRVLVSLGPRHDLEGLLKEVTFRDAAGVALPATVRAKTGTLNFVSALAGYVTGAGGRKLAFAIFTGDTARRDAIPESQREDPPGASAWVKRSKRLQAQLIADWASAYAV
jgi:D-alanyl-D-alanine carboxypeptidase/D-alanyl-D-alanine-endopeptidase (penicillin-binding protein 4)